MLSGIFQKRKKIQELRAPSLQDIKKFREVYGRHADKRHVETPACFERSIYKAISCQKELHAIDFRQEDVTDPQIIALAETLVEMPMVSSLDLRDNRITDDGAKALLEVLRLQIIASKTPPKTDPKTKKLLAPTPVPEYTRYVTNVNLKGNEISAGVLQEMAQYTELLKREDKRLEIRAALNQIDRNSGGGVDEEDFKAVVKLLTGTEPGKKEVKQLMNQSHVGGDSLQNSIALENVLLAKCSSSPSKKAACPPWEALVQTRHADIGTSSASVSVPSRGFTPSRSPESLRQPTLPVPPAPTVAAASVQVRVIGQDATTSIQTSRDHAAASTFEAQATPPTSMVASPISPPVASPTPFAAPPAPIVQARTASVSSLSVDVESSVPSPQAKPDFRPPSSPPPPLPLPQTTSPDRRGTGTSAMQMWSNSGETITDGSESSQSTSASTAVARNSLDASSIARTSITSSAPPPVTRQNSSDNHSYYSTPTSPSQSAVSPVPRDDFAMEMASWRDDELFADDDDVNSYMESSERERNERPASETRRGQDESRSVTSKTSGSSSTRIKAGNDGNMQRNDAPSLASNYGEASEGDGESAAARRGLVKRHSDDLSSLAYNDQVDNGAGHLPDVSSSGSVMQQMPTSTSSVHDDEPEDDEECVDSIVIDIMKDGKPRNVAKVIHSEFNRGLALQEFPGEVPFRNLVALILSENGLRDLSLFKECRFPCTTVLDLSQNALTKLNDDELACFPKLQVVDLSNNRLKTISGLGKLYDVKALNLSNNNIRNVINIEHLVQLQVLRLRGNAIAATSALRLLSLNKMLSHLDLDDNAIVETDDRQRRKVTSHILNIIPTLSSLGSVPIAGHHSKDKRKLTSVDSMGKSVLEHDEYPDLRSTWASNACDILQIVQDQEPEVTRQPDDDDDPYGDYGTTTTGGSSSPSRQKKISREQQRQRDELRSKSVAYRSRDKAPPSPVRHKTSPFAFGPPQPPPPQKSTKKKPIQDPKLAQEQKRRASQLSEPKHPPVDQAQLKQEQRRKSRPTFDVNMSVAERLQLVREKSLRRTSTLTPHAEMGMHHRESAIASGSETHHAVRAIASHHEPALVMAIRSDPHSPSRASPMRTQTQSIVEFRIEPLPIGSPSYSRNHTADNQHANPAHSPTNGKHSESVQKPVDADRKPSLKESSFLQSLAVSDFLNHAEEEISTALTALNVLLSICERAPSDLKKLNEYRGSLEALDILNERESQELFQKARHHDDSAKVRECTSEFEKLSTLKKCINELLHKLEDHAPGSPTIRSYCENLRSTKLRDIIVRSSDDCDVSVNNGESAGDHKPRESSVSPPRSPVVVKQTATKETEKAKHGSPTGHSSPAQVSLHSRLFASTKSEESEPERVDVTPTQSLSFSESAAVINTATKSDDVDEFDFLSSETSMFDDDEPPSPPSPRPVVAAASTSSHEDLFAENDEVHVDQADHSDDVGETADSDYFATEIETPSAAPSPVMQRHERSHSATSTDITQDIQQDEKNDDDKDDGDFDFDAELLLDDAPSDAATAESPIEAANEDLAAEESACVADLGEGQEVENENEAAHEEEEGEYDWEAEAPVADEVDATEEEEDEATAQVDPAEEEEGQEDQEPASVNDDPASESTAVVEDGDDEQVVEAEDEDDEEAETFGDWEKGFDPSTNHYFWFNHETGESQWVPPDGWPYEVDTPFEEDAEVQEGEEEEAEAEGEDDGGDEEEVTPTEAQEEEEEEGDGDAYANESPESPPKSSFDDEDDVFSDQDLPDF